jgi:hypothetical protein
MDKENETVEDRIKEINERYEREYEEKLKLSKMPSVYKD